MTQHSSRLFEQLPYDVAARPRPPRTDTYAISRFNEADSLEMTHFAWRVHAEGYETMGFVKPTAVTDDGYLATGIDKARGAYIDYYVGLPKQQRGDAEHLDAATMRKINIPAEGAVADLPAYQLCKDSLYPEEHVALLELDDAEARLKEIAALARTPSASPLSIFELFRHAHNEAVGEGEIWFSSIVSTTYESLVEAFGDRAVRQVGEPVPMHDERVSKTIELVPMIVDLDRFIDNMCESLAAETDPQRIRRLMRSIYFFAEGLHDDELSDEAIAIREMVREQAQLRGE